MTPPFIRLASCRDMVKGCWNRRWKSVRSLAYTTCSHVSDSSSDTRVLCHPLTKTGKFKAIETYDQLRNQGNSALLFLRQLKESGFKKDLETYMSVLRLRYQMEWEFRSKKKMDWDLDVSSDDFLNDVINNTNLDEMVSYEISDDLFEVLMEENMIEALETLVEVYASAGRFEEAIHTLSEMKRRGGRLVVSKETCNHVLNKLIKLGKEDMVESVYRQMKTNGLIPNEATYRNLIRGLCRKGCFKEAWDVIEQMEEAGVDPTAFTYQTYISGLCLKGSPDLAFQVVKNLRESDKPVDVFAYRCVIRGFVTDLKLQDAVDALHDMELSEVVPDEDCYAFLIRGYCRKGEIVKALDLCKEMESRGIKTDHLFVRSMMQYLCGVGILDEALCVFKYFMQQSSFFLLDAFSFNIAIDTAFKLGKVGDALGLLEEMKRRKFKPLVMHALGVEPTGVQGQWVQPNVGQHEGVQSEVVHDGVVQDAREQAALDFVGKLHTT